MRANCTFSHWGTDGLKPYMRYTLAGGEQYSSENISGIDFCPPDSNRYIAKSIKANLDEAMDGLMNSRGHRRNILNPYHHKVSIGISYQRPTLWLVQLFVGDYVQYSLRPTIEDGILSASGVVNNGARVNVDTIGFQIYYDQPPRQLTRGQLHQTSCGNNGRIVASLRRPLRSNAFYSTDSFTQSGTRCTDPYQVSSRASVAYSYFEPRLHVPVLYRHDAVWITATDWEVANNDFSVIADISDLLNQYGDGVYTIVLWGEIDFEQTPISEHSIFIPPYEPPP